jgi:molybdopterin synthase catalytic subunit
MTDTSIDIRVQNTALDPSAEQDALRRGRPNIGALVAFVGLMRDISEAREVVAMTLEHYPGMTERALAQIADQAARRWQIDGIRIIHRVGRLLPEDPILLVAVISQHRTEAFRACEFLIDYLKTRAPFWKKEATDQGSRWVDARQSDDDAAKRWKETGP